MIKNILKKNLLRIWLIPATYLVVCKMKLNEKYPDVFIFTILGILAVIFIYRFIKEKREAK
jgi:hypothetical protein